MIQAGPTGIDPPRLRLMWLVFLLAPVIYLVVAILVMGGLEPPALDPELLRWITIFLSMLSGLEILFVLLFRQILAAVARGNYRNYCLVRWAILESIAVYGLVLVLLGQELFVASAFCILSLGMLAMTGPAEGDRQSFLELVE